MEVTRSQGAVVVLIVGQLGLQRPMLSVSTNVASSNPAQARFDLWRLTPLSTIFQLYRGGDQVCQCLAAGRCFFSGFFHQ